MARRGLSCSMWAPVPQPGVRPQPPALTMWKLSRWTTWKSQKGCKCFVLSLPPVVILDETKISHHKFNKMSEKKDKKHSGFNLSLPTHYLHVNTIFHNEKKKLAKITLVHSGKQNRNKQTKKTVLFCSFFIFGLWYLSFLTRNQTQAPSSGSAEM